jgi:MtfA peptidase
MFGGQKGRLIFLITGYLDPLLALILAVITIALLIVLLFRLRLHLRWLRAVRSSLSTTDQELLRNHFPAYQALSPSEQQRLEFLIQYFLKFKKVSVLAGEDLTRLEHLLLAAHASLLLIHLSVVEPFKHVTNIFITPASYIEKDNPVLPWTGRPRYFERIGELRKRGPMILSREAIAGLITSRRTFSNVIVHEFSHELDQVDGYFDGTPVLDSQERYARWALVMGREFHQLQLRLRRHKSSGIDRYGAHNEAEFFAVVAEHFFSAPHDLMAKYPDLFHLYQDYFGLDPRRWQHS